ncbi:hypothetical protein Afil01_23660 [Actinorhabdospora filicis]|uniref:Transthyretin/hydroxyisourate hydrolase domain-containing protein n=1 Tax=Actinorhabdospora filicis TaxID=1785913 RepID=A0A9W6SKW1_9ACTN|nr:hydroxyisourate hydrolase [Actinorhabdospora filicis]GLZ77559.1 hypothetical protein Afil01_23660 [Actinorhabdospora filicis]
MTVSLRVLDAHNGLPVEDLPVRLEHRGCEGWSTVDVARTDCTGRVEQWDVPSGAAYRCVLDTDRHFTPLGLTGFYTEIILALRCSAMRVTILVAPHFHLVHDENP